MPTRKLTPVQVLERLLSRLEKRMESLQRIKLDGFQMVISEFEPPGTGSGYSNSKRTASASQPVIGLNCIQESFSLFDLLRCSFVAHFPFR